MQYNTIFCTLYYKISQHETFINKLAQRKLTTKLLLSERI